MKLVLYGDIFGVSWETNKLHVKQVSETLAIKFVLCVNPRVKLISDLKTRVSTTIFSTCQQSRD